VTGREWMVVLLVLAGGCGKKTPPASAPAVEVADERAFDPSAPLHAKVALAIDKLRSGSPEDLALAVAILEQSLPGDPSGATALDLAIALQRQGRVAEAVPHYERVLAAHPDWGEVPVYLGSALERLDRAEEAERTYRAAIGTDPENMGARVALIAVLREQGRPDDAIEEAKRALEVNANSLAVYNNFALAYLDKGDTTLARFILDKALQGIEGAQTNAYLHTNLGWSHYLDDNKPAALQSLDRAVELEPRLVPALVYLATVYLEDRNYEDMIPLLETARDEDPDNADVMLNLGIAYRGLQRFDEAERAWKTALELAPDDAAPWFNLGILWGDSLKRYEAAVEAFTKYIEGGGAEAERAQEYIEAVNKERETAERRRRAAEARKQREAERKREQEMLEEARAAEADDPAASPDEASQPDEAPQPDATAGPGASSDEEAPAAPGSSEPPGDEPLDDEEAP